VHLRASRTPYAWRVVRLRGRRMLRACPMTCTVQARAACHASTARCPCVAMHAGSRAGARHGRGSAVLREAPPMRPDAGQRADGRGACGAAAGSVPCDRDALFLHCQALTALASSLRGRAPAALRALGAAALRLAAARGGGSAHAAVAAAGVACAARDWAGLAVPSAELQARPRAWLHRAALRHSGVITSKLQRTTDATYDQASLHGVTVTV